MALCEASRSGFDVVRIVRYLEDKIEPSVQGLAIFACSAAKITFRPASFELHFSAISYSYWSGRKSIQWQG